MQFTENELVNSIMRFIKYIFFQFYCNFIVIWFNLLKMNKLIQ